MDSNTSGCDSKGGFVVNMVINLKGAYNVIAGTTVSFSSGSLLRAG
jgi:hypothetical protein